MNHYQLFLDLSQRCNYYLIVKIVKLLSVKKNIKIKVQTYEFCFFRHCKLPIIRGRIIHIAASGLATIGKMVLCIQKNWSTQVSLHLPIILDYSVNPIYWGMLAFRLCWDRHQLCFIILVSYNETLECGGTHQQSVIFGDPLTKKLPYKGQWRCPLLPTPNRPTTPSPPMDSTVAGTLQPKYRFTSLSH